MTQKLPFNGAYQTRNDSLLFGISLILQSCLFVKEPLAYELVPHLKAGVPSAIFRSRRRLRLSRFSTSLVQAVTPGLECFQVLTQLWPLRNKHRYLARLTVLVAAVLGHQRIN